VKDKLKPESLLRAFVDNGVYFYSGVPDSVLGPFCHCIQDTPSTDNIVAANEGNAIGHGVGYYAATSNVPLVYMQNSGLGNAIDPLVSLVDKSVFGVPMILLIGWRGQPRTKDEPQHIKQGEITTEQLEILDIPYEVISSNAENMRHQVSAAIDGARENTRPYALLVENGIFEDYRSTNKHKNKRIKVFTREMAINVVAETINESDVLVAGIGKSSRELFEYRTVKEQSHNKDLLVVGGMGHASSVALGIARQTKKRVYCLDGDGAMSMHLGAVATIAADSPSNFYHILLDNSAHDSVGGHSTTNVKVNFSDIAKASQYATIVSVNSEAMLKKAILGTRRQAAPVFIHVTISPGARIELTRPDHTPRENINSFQRFINKS
jgi:phosphonopyruvate decarboxylase